MPRLASVEDLLGAYDGFLLDAYGVLKDASGALPGACELVARLDDLGKPYVVVTNDASRLPATIARSLAGLGMAIPAERIVTSGSLLAPHFAAAGLVGARCMVVGTADSHRYVADAGGVIAPLAGTADIDALIVCDDAGFDFLPGIEAALSAAVRALDAGRPLALVLPNPDLVYPKGSGQYGFTSGAIALLIETALRRRHPGRDVAFTQLGKPRPPMFAEARRRLGGDRLLMVGDQLETDVAGALAAGIDAALVTGVSRWTPDAAIEPTWIVEGLAS